MSAPLVPVYCANPACVRASYGRPRVLGKWRPAPGAAVEPLACKSCRHVTRLTVLADGTVQTLVRMAPKPRLPQAA
jgi:hypothetical protein